MRLCSFIVVLLVGISDALSLLRHDGAKHQSSLLADSAHHNRHHTVPPTLTPSELSESEVTKHGADPAKTKAGCMCGIADTSLCLARQTFRLYTTDGTYKGCLVRSKGGDKYTLRELDKNKCMIADGTCMVKGWMRRSGISSDDDDSLGVSSDEERERRLAEREAEEKRLAKLPKRTFLKKPPSHVKLPEGADPAFTKGGCHCPERDPSRCKNWQSFRINKKVQSDFSDYTYGRFMGCLIRTMKDEWKYVPSRNHWSEDHCMRATHTCLGWEAAQKFDRINSRTRW